MFERLSRPRMLNVALFLERAHSFGRDVSGNKFVMFENKVAMPKIRLKGICHLHNRI